MSLDQEPLTMEELEALAAKRIEAFKQARRAAFGPAHIAIVHARVGELEFSVGVSAFGGIDSIVAPSPALTKELWDLGKQAAHEMYNDNAWDLEEVNLLATIIVDQDSPQRHMWISSPGEDDSIEVVLFNKDQVDVGTVPGRKWSFPIECGFNAAKKILEIAEDIPWN
jgi:hypothetical protein